MSRIKNMLSGVFRGPVFWGCVVSIAFYTAIHQNYISNPLVRRYFAGRPVEYVTTVLSFVALAALVIKFIELVREPRLDDSLWLGPIPPEKQPVTDCDSLLERLDESAAAAGNSVLGRRLREALESVRRHGTAAKLDDELRNMADVAAGGAHANMALVRTIIACVPVLGFLGTVIGITQAVAHLSEVIGQVSFSQAVNSVVGGLSEGFDATALALALSMLLMFLLFFVNNKESRLLSMVEVRAIDELVGRFEPELGHSDPSVAAVRQMADEVVLATERLVERQSALWQETVEAAQKRWTGQAVTTEKQLETALSKALRNSLETHAEHLRQTEQAVHEAGSQRWQQAIAALERGTAAISAQQAELHQHGKVLLQVVDATGRIIKLEDALNNNLDALAGSHHFEQTVLSLSAAVNLLGARLGQPANSNAPGSPRVELRRTRPVGNAA